MLTLEQIVELLPRWEQFIRQHLGGTDVACMDQVLDPEAAISMYPEGLREDPRFIQLTLDSMRLMPRPDEEWVAGTEFLAENYGFMMSIPDHTKIMAELLNFLDSARVVVDIGCGPCSYLGFLLAEGIIAPERIVGVDPSAGAMKRGRELMEAAGVEIELLQEFGQQLSLADGCADLVFSIDTIHWSHAWRKCLREMARITAPQGRLFLTHTTGCPRTMGEINELKVTEILAAAGVNIRNVKHFMSEGSMSVRIVYIAVKERQSGLIIPGRIT